MPPDHVSNCFSRFSIKLSLMKICRFSTPPKSITALKEMAQLMSHVSEPVHDDNKAVEII